MHFFVVVVGEGGGRVVVVGNRGNGIVSKHQKLKENG